MVGKQFRIGQGGRQGQCVGSFSPTAPSLTFSLTITSTSVAFHFSLASEFLSILYQSKSATMAKGLRASSRKKNNTALREKIFTPAVDARTERLSAKLQELAAKPRPDQERKMDVDEQPEEEQEEQKSTESPHEGKSRFPSDPACILTAMTEMDVDARGAKMKPVKRQNIRTGGRGRIAKKISRRKENNSVVFAHVRAKWARTAKAKTRK
jgi:Protein of unknown function (DUF2423)